MAELMIPDPEQVAVAWAKTLELPMGSAVATTVPEASGWPVVEGATTRAFLQVFATGGGRVGDTPLGRTVMSVDSWATKTSSDRPPLRLASHVLSRIVGATYSGDFPVELDMGAGVQRARVHSAYVVSQPRRIPDQDTSRAHYSMDLALLWAVA